MVRVQPCRLTLAERGKSAWTTENPVANAACLDDGGIRSKRNHLALNKRDHAVDPCCESLTYSSLGYKVKRWSIQRPSDTHIAL
jgi:hypothetical protein